MRRINWNIFVKILLLSGFSAFDVYIVLTGKVKLYVHPRIIPYIIFSSAAMFAAACFMSRDILKKHENKLNIRRYVIFIIPLILSLAVQPKVIGADMLQNGSINAGQSENNSTGSNNTGASQQKQNDENKKYRLDISGSNIVVHDENFVFSLDEITGNIDKYENYTIEITGFVFKSEKFSKDEFAAARFMMTCCTADMQLVGIVCQGPGAEAYTNNTWVKVKGKLKKEKYEGQQTAVIVISSIEKIKKPENEYVYPF